MLSVGIFPNTKKECVKPILENVLDFFQIHNINVFLPEEAANGMGYPELAIKLSKLKEIADLGITLGGDGTLLNTVRDLYAAEIPICGVNLGQLGFLTEIETCQLKESLQQIVTHDYFIEERLMLEAIVIRQGNEIYVSSALNDIVVTKGGFSRLIKLELFVDGQLTAKYPADGLIIATSTGSTGYSLSAGGPIVNPNLKVIVLTPICPHTLQTRSIIVSENEDIQVKMHASHEDIVLTVDGQKIFNLFPDDIVVVRKSPFRARFIRLNGNNYYEKLRTKLRRGDKDEHT